MFFIKGLREEKESCLFLGNFPKPQENQDSIRGLSAEPTSLQAPRWASRDTSALPVTVCMTSKGRPWVSSVVRKTRMQIAQDPSLNYEYTPVMGMKSFVQASLNLLFGKNSQVIVENRVRSRALLSLTETRGVETGGLGLYNRKHEKSLEGPRKVQSVPSPCIGGQSRDQDPKPGVSTAAPTAAVPALSRRE